MKPTGILTAALLCVLSPISFAKPLKVFILAGQSNMEGHAAVSTLDYIGKDPLTAPLLKEMRNPDGTPRVCDKVSNNLCHDNEHADLFVEVNHGPFVVDNNLFLSPKAIEDDSQGGAYAHNLIAGGIDLCPDFFDGRKTPFHKAHSTEIVALHDNPSGDSRYYNNLFMRGGSLEKYDQAHLPMSMDGDVFFQRAKSSKHESAPINRSASDPGLTLVEKKDGFYLTMTIATALGSERPSQPVTSARLGKARISGCAFENPDGSPITIGTDYFGKPRNAANPTPGPFEAPGSGTITMRVWPLTVGRKAK